MAELDRSRPFGQVSGILDNNARFEQDGKLFDIDGKELDGLPEPVVEAPVVDEAYVAELHAKINAYELELAKYDAQVEEYKQSLIELSAHVESQKQELGRRSLVAESPLADAPEGEAFVGFSQEAPVFEAPVAEIEVPEVPVFEAPVAEIEVPAAEAPVAPVTKSRKTKAQATSVDSMF